MTSTEHKKSWNAAYYQRNKARILARNEAWWKAHPEKLKAKWRRKSKSIVGREHARRNREKHKAVIAVKKAAWQKSKKGHLRNYLRDYYLKNKDKIKERTSRWYRTNPGRASVHRIRRRNKQAEAALSEVSIINEWMRRIRKTDFVRCHWCGTKVLGRKAHFDHVTPLSKGGRHSIDNLCATCPDCNLTKHSRLISDWIARGQMFLPL